MPLNSAIITGIIVAVVVTVLMCIFIIPEGAGKHLPGFLCFIHDLVNFKIMVLEPVIKVLYVFCSLGCIFTGILLLFTDPFWVGLIVLIAGPLVLRILYEMVMLFVIQVQNTISINRKLKK